MAVAKVGKIHKVQKTITKIVEVKEPEKIVLEMTLDEASFLKNLLGCIGGSPNGPRKHVNSIYDAMESVIPGNHEHKITFAFNYLGNEKKNSVYIESALVS